MQTMLNLSQRVDEKKLIWATYPAKFFAVEIYIIFQGKRKKYANKESPQGFGRKVLPANLISLLLGSLKRLGLDSII